MTHRAEELEAAAKGINRASLEAAKVAIASACEEYIRWADLFSERLGAVKPSELHKFCRALSLTMLGHLPTRPNTCPFCIQYGRDKSCLDCGYAATHGRCDEVQSAFSLFIEAFVELGRLIYQDTNELKCHPVYAKRLLNITIQTSIDIARKMQEDLPSASAIQLMQRKAAYLGGMIKLLPVELFGEEVKDRCRLVQKALINYW
jgi:hypothetical protein